jgi:hypothetical protein
MFQHLHHQRLTLPASTYWAGWSENLSTRLLLGQTGVSRVTIGKGSTIRAGFGDELIKENNPQQSLLRVLWHRTSDTMAAAHRIT